MCPWEICVHGNIWNTTGYTGTPVLLGGIRGIFYLIFDMCTGTPNVLILQLFLIKMSKNRQKVYEDDEIRRKFVKNKPNPPKIGENSS